jgi:TRAP-type C4-dicarboxylate transport system permease small subunit
MKVSRIVNALVVVTLLATPLSAFATAFTVSAPAGTSTRALPDAIVAILNVLLVLVAIGAFIFLLVGGARYIGSSGDEDAAAAAKNTILYAILGLIVIGLAAAILNFVAQALVG